MDLSVKLCGISLASPFVLGSGPLGNTAQGLAACSAAGGGRTGGSGRTARTGDS